MRVGLTYDLREEYVARKPAWFDRLQCFLTAKPRDDGYARIAAELDSSEGAVRQAVHRLRRRFREALQTEVAETVADPAEIDGEIRYLIRVLTG